MTLAVEPMVADWSCAVPRSGDRLCRAIDIAAAATLIAILAPLLVLISLAVKLTSAGPVVFSHPRIGRDGRPFRCYKFRSMVCDAEERLAELLASDPAASAEWAVAHKLRKDPRITPIGNFLRRSSMDELPQLFNVLFGDMSLVGPRPVTFAEAQRYGRYFREYCRVRPGITGLWQISGRSDTSYRRRIALDVAFIRARDVKLYLRILIGTVPCVLMSRGSY
jgi:exopolysaccharide production protein ExoY